VVRNGIAGRQNEDRSVRALAAQRRLYSRAKLLTGARGVATAIIPVATWLASVRWPTIKSLGAALGIGWVFLDYLMFARAEAHWRLSAARLQEWFDTHVLLIPWNSALVGSPPCAEDLVDVGVPGRSDNVREDLRDWYPPAVDQLPIGWGRLSCQRINAWWDGSQHRSYARVVTTFLVLGVGVPVLAALRANATLHGFLLAYLAPLAPLITWAFRERDQHVAAASKLDGLRAAAVTAWQKSVEAVTEPDVVAGRVLQDQVFDARRSSPPVFDWFYRLQRSRRDPAAVELVDEMVRALRRSA
jgi:hypothetical protein